MTDHKEMSTKYDPNQVEAGRYQDWLDADLFKPNANPDAKPYSIVIPPPNVTGKLHLGHAWDTTLQSGKNGCKGMMYSGCQGWIMPGLQLKLKWKQN